MVDETKTNEQPKDVPMQKPGRPIGDLVNQEFVNQIMEMGFSRNVAEKSLLYTQNLSVEKAFDWINEHNSDPDFEDEERVEDTSTVDPS